MPPPSNRLPLDVLMMIFSEFRWDKYDIPPQHNTAFPPFPVSSKLKMIPDPELTISTGDAYYSSWFQYIHNMKILTRVCRQWRACASPLLYSCVILHRIGQLPALIRTLEETLRPRNERHPNSTVNLGVPSYFQKSGGILNFGYGYGVWIKHIRIEIFVPREWSNLYRMLVPRLLELCTSVQTIIHRPEIDDVYENQYRQSLQRLIINHNLPHLRNLRELTLSELCPNFGDGLSLSYFQGLTKLDIGLVGIQESGKLQLQFVHEDDDMDVETEVETENVNGNKNENNPSLVLPHLETLIIRTNHICYHPLNIITDQFLLPALQHLTIDMKCLEFGSITLDHIETFLSSHGSQLRTFVFIGSDSKPLFHPGEINRLIALCPRLTHLAYTDTAFGLSDNQEAQRYPYVHMSLQHVVLLRSNTFLERRGSFTIPFLAIETFSDRRAFPYLSTITLQSRYYGDTTTDALSPTYISTILSFIDHLNAVDIIFLGGDGRPMIEWLDQRVVDDDDDDSDFTSDEWDSYSEDSDSEDEMDMDPPRQFYFGDALPGNVFPLPQNVLEHQTGELLRIFEGLIESDGSEEDWESSEDESWDEDWEDEDEDEWEEEE